MQSAQIISADFPKKESRNKHNLPINERLKKARMKKKLSSQQVVNKLKKQGISIGHSTLQGYEADESSLNHRYPSISVINILADFYGVSIDYLFGRTDVMKVRQKRVPPDFKKELSSNRITLWDGKPLTRTQSDIILAAIEAIVSDNE
jgi:transcriptional regulator with XRE-family HTH domain